MEKFEFGGEIVWRPTPELIAQSHLQRFMDRHGIRSLDELMRRSTADIAWFWDAVLHELAIQFYSPYSRIVDLSRGMPWPQWCVGGEMNVIHNCLDKHEGTPADSHIAVRWEGEEGAVRTLTCAELRREVNRAANALRSLGLGKGDAVGVFMPMTPEIVRSEEHTSELQSHHDLVCRLLLEKKKISQTNISRTLVTQHR